MPLESFLIELHRHDHPCRDWEGRVIHYVSVEPEATVKQLLHELRQIETRLLIHMHKLEKSGFFRDSGPVEAQDFAYFKWIHCLVETVETELQAIRGKGDRARLEKEWEAAADFFSAFWPPAMATVQETAVENS